MRYEPLPASRWFWLWSKISEKEFDDKRLL
jgi:hypothetical protein